MTWVSQGGHLYLGKKGTSLLCVDISPSSRGTCGGILQRQGDPRFESLIVLGAPTRTRVRLVPEPGQERAARVRHVPSFRAGRFGTRQGAGCQCIAMFPCGIRNEDDGTDLLRRAYARPPTDRLGYRASGVERGGQEHDRASISRSQSRDLRSPRAPGAVDRDCRAVAGRTRRRTVLGASEAVSRAELERVHSVDHVAFIDSLTGVSRWLAQDTTAVSPGSVTAARLAAGGRSRCGRGRCRR